MNSDAEYSDFEEDGDENNEDENSAAIFIYNWDFVHHARPDLCEDEISTVVFSDNDSCDSGHHVLLPWDCDIEESCENNIKNQHILTKYIY